MGGGDLRRPLYWEGDALYSDTEGGAHSQEYCSYEFEVHGYGSVH